MYRKTQKKSTFLRSLNRKLALIWNAAAVDYVMHRPVVHDHARPSNAVLTLVK